MASPKACRLTHPMHTTEAIQSCNIYVLILWRLSVYIYVCVCDDDDDDDDDGSVGLMSCFGHIVLLFVLCNSIYDFNLPKRDVL
jgi:hypothetical protein